MKQNYLQFLYNSMIRFLPLIETFLSCELMKTFVHLLSSESLDGPLQSKKLPGTHIARSRECDIHWTCFKRYMQKVCRRGSFAQGIQNNLLLSRKATRCVTHRGAFIDYVIGCGVVKIISPSGYAYAQGVGEHSKLSQITVFPIWKVK